MKKLYLLSETWKGEDGKTQRRDIALCTKGKAFRIMQVESILKGANSILIKPNQEFVKTEIPVNRYLPASRLDFSSVKI